MLEKEYKTLLTEAEYLHVDRMFNWDDTFTQINFYYDDKRSYLSLNNITVRVRCKGEHIFLQIKIPVSTNGALHIKKEYETELSVIPQKIESNILANLIGREMPSVELLGVLITERKTCNIEGAEIDLDKNRYCNVTDYELEVEFFKDAPVKLLKQLNNIGIGFEKCGIGKYTRFLKEYTRK